MSLTTTKVTIQVISDKDGNEINSEPKNFNGADIKEYFEEEQAIHLGYCKANEYPWVYILEPGYDLSDDQKDEFETFIIDGNKFSLRTEIITSEIVPNTNANVVPTIKLQLLKINQVDITPESIANQGDICSEKIPAYVKNNYKVVIKPAKSTTFDANGQCDYEIAGSIPRIMSDDIASGKAIGNKDFKFKFLSESLPLPPPVSNLAGGGLTSNTTTFDIGPPLAPEEEKPSSARQVSVTEQYKTEFHWADKNIPVSAENILIKLHNHFRWLDSKQQRGRLDIDITNQLLSDEDTLEYIEKLEKRLEIEELYQYSGEISTSVESIKRCLLNDEPIYSDIVASCQRMLIAIRPVNILQLIEFATQTKNASSLINGKDIILILGPTGAGKSTTIHFLCGSAFGSQGNRVFPLEPYPLELKDFKVSPSVVSETSAVNAIELKSKNIWICDTPGFDDSRGVEIDIANGLGITEAVRTAKSVRILCLFSQDIAGNRWQLFKQYISDPLSKMLVSEKYVKSSIVFFNKFKKDVVSSRQIIENINSLAINKNEAAKSDRTYGAVLKNLMDCINEGASSSEDISSRIKRENTSMLKLIIDPMYVKDGYGNFLNRLASIEPITNPREVFKQFTNQKSISMLKDQLEKQQTCIEKCLLRVERSSDFLEDIKLFTFKLQELKDLKGCIEYDELSIAYNKSLDSFKQRVKEMRNKFASTLKLFQEANVTDSTVEDIKSNVLMLMLLLNLNESWEKHFSDETSLKFQCRSALEIAMKSLRDEAVSLKDILDCEDIDDLEDKLKGCASSFKKLHMYGSFIEPHASLEPVPKKPEANGEPPATEETVLEQPISEIIKEYKADTIFVTNGAFDKVTAIFDDSNDILSRLRALDILLLFIQEYSDILPDAKIKKQYKTRRDEVKKEISFSILSARKLLTTWDHDDLKQTMKTVSESIAILSTANSHKRVKNHFSFSEALEELLQTTGTFAKDELKSIDTMLPGSFCQVKVKIDAIDYLRSSNIVSNLFKDEYVVATGSISKVIARAQHFVSEEINKFKLLPKTDDAEFSELTPMFNWKVLEDNLKILDDAKCFEGHTSECYKSNYNVSCEDITKYLGELKEDMNGQKISIHQHKKLSVYSARVLIAEGCKTVFNKAAENKENKEMESKCIALAESTMECFEKIVSVTLNTYIVEPNGIECVIVFETHDKKEDCPITSNDKAKGMSSLFQFLDAVSRTFMRDSKLFRESLIRCEAAIRSYYDHMDNSCKKFLQVLTCISVQSTEMSSVEQARDKLIKVIQTQQPLRRFMADMQTSDSSEPAKLMSLFFIEKPEELARYVGYEITPGFIKSSTESGNSKESRLKEFFLEIKGLLESKGNSDIDSLQYWYNLITTGLSNLDPYLRSEYQFKTLCSDISGRISNMDNKIQQTLVDLYMNRKYKDLRDYLDKMKSEQSPEQFKSILDSAIPNFTEHLKSEYKSVTRTIDSSAIDDPSFSKQFFEGISDLVSVNGLFESILSRDDQTIFRCNENELESKCKKIADDCYNALKVLLDQRDFKKFDEKVTYYKFFVGSCKIPFEKFDSSDTDVDLKSSYEKIVRHVKDIIEKARAAAKVESSKAKSKVESKAKSKVESKSKSKSESKDFSSILSATADVAISFAAGLSGMNRFFEEADLEDTEAVSDVTVEKSFLDELHEILKKEEIPGVLANLDSIVKVPYQTYCEKVCEVLISELHNNLRGEVDILTLKQCLKVAALVPETFSKDIKRKLHDKIKHQEEEEKKKQLELEALDNQKAFDGLFKKYKSAFEGVDGTFPDMFTFIDCRSRLLRLLNSNCEGLEDEFKKENLEKLMISLPEKYNQLCIYYEFYVNDIDKKVEWAIDNYGRKPKNSRSKTPVCQLYFASNYYYRNYGQLETKDNLDTFRRFLKIWTSCQTLISKNVERLLQPESSVLKHFEKFKTDFTKLKGVIEFARQGLSQIDFGGKDPFHIEKLLAVIVKASDLYKSSESKVEEHLSVLSDKKTADASQIKSALHQIAEHLDGLKVASESGFYFDVINWPIKDEIKRSLYPFEKARELYSSMISKIVKAMDSWILLFKTDLLSKNELTHSPNGSDRDMFYSDLYVKYKLIGSDTPTTFKNHANEVVTKLQDTHKMAAKHLERQLELIEAELKSLLLGLPTDKQIDLDTTVLKDNVQRFSNLRDNLRSFNEKFEEDSLRLRNIANAKLVSINNEFTKVIWYPQMTEMKRLCQLPLEGFAANVEMLMDMLVNSQIITDNLVWSSSKLSEEVDKVLGSIKDDTIDGSAKLLQLSHKLNARHDPSSTSRGSDGTVKRIIEEHKVFKTLSILWRNSKTSSKTVAKILEEMVELQDGKPNLNQLTKEFVDSISKQAEKFEIDFWKTVEDGLKNTEAACTNINVEIANLDLDPETIARKVTARSSDFTEFTDLIILLMTKLFAWWTLSNAGDFSPESFKSVDDRKQLQYPTASQIVCLLCLFHSASTSPDGALLLTKQFVQIPTGEGKSLILGIMSTILALLGMNIDCVCYSAYLSARDYKDFEPMFKAFNLIKFIKYNTFDKLCNDFINEPLKAAGKGGLREAVQSVLTQQTSQFWSTEGKPRPKVLLVDEVDVFFSEHFYGNYWPPVAKIKDQLITNFVNFLWRVKDDKAALAKWKESSEYKECETKFSKWKDMLLDNMRRMVYDLKNMKDYVKGKDYIVEGGKIGYVHLDGTSFDQVDSYKTMWAYMREFDNKLIEPKILDNNICLFIYCGQFSYADIPKQYNTILGVTGTLDTMTQVQRDLFEKDYDIRKYLYIPSVYGKNQLKFAKVKSSQGAPEDFFLEENSLYHGRIVDEIKRRLCVTKDETKRKIGRAILVFFDSIQNLRDFRNSDSLKKKGWNVLELTEETTAIEKDRVIKTAIQLTKITLLTRAFGRGTDFRCYDSKLLRLGGVHVIQTFFSEDLSEEVQIKGRTARQGDEGSFSFVLSEDGLAPFYKEKKDRNEVIKSMRDREEFYFPLNERRNRLFEETFPEKTRNVVDELRKKHEDSMTFSSKLKDSSDEKSIIDFLTKENKSAVKEDDSKVFRTIVLMDATGSMSDLIKRCKNTIEEMFKRARLVIESLGITNPFEIQLAVYRNYDAPFNPPKTTTGLLDYSNWEILPANLKFFMETVEADHGLGNEAIEIGLWHVNNEIRKTVADPDLPKINQVILIGDMPPNTASEVNSKRKDNHGGESYWNSRLGPPTTWDKELEIMKQLNGDDPLNNCPIHCFYVDSQAKKKFEQIASATGGKSGPLNLKIDKGAEELKDVVTAKICHSIAGEEGERQYFEMKNRGFV